MPIRKDDSGRRWVEMELLVPGTPEQVWHAIATGPGMTSWFTPTTVDERVGGAITFDLGECGTQPATVTAWEPPVRFCYEELGWSENTPLPGPLATEITVTSRSGDQCVVRMVHSLFTEKDDWDGELESFESGWPGFFEVLRVYLKHFAGKPSAIVHAMVGRQGADAAVWSTLTSALNLAATNVGDHRRSPSGAPRLSGVVERIRQDAKSRELMLRIDEPAEGIALIGTCPTGPDQSGGAVSLYLYGVDAADTARREQPAWSAWLQELLAGEPAVP